MTASANIRLLLGNDFKVLTPVVLKKLEQRFSYYEDNIQALKEELSEFKSSTERSTFQLNNELQASNEKLEKETESCEQFKTQAKELEEKLNKLQNENSALQNSHRDCSNRIHQLESTVKQLSQDKISIVEVLEKKNEEIKTLEDNMKATCSQLASANNAKFEALLKVQEAEIENDNWKHQKNRLTQEKDLLSEQITTLNREIGEKSAEILRLSKDKSSRVLDLQSELEHKTLELEQLQTLLSDLRQTVKVRDKRVEALALRVKDVQDGQHRSEEQFTLEINAHIQLAQLHKETAEESQARVKELMKTIESIHDTCAALTKSRDEAEIALKEAQGAGDDKVKEMNEEMENLKKELNEAQKKLGKLTVVSEEALEQMFPEAAASNRLLRKGFSLTEMYSTYRRSEEELLSKTQECKSLQQQLKDLHEELEEREPVIQLRMKELQKATETITLMHDQMHNTSQYVDKLETERDDALRVSGFHKREHSRLKQTTEDLSAQVQFLLKEMEEAAGRHIITSEDESKLFHSDQTSTDLVISDHLVTFKNLKELQEQNQKLLAVSRELGQQLEEKDLELTQERTTQLKEQLDAVLKELEALKEERKVQTSIVESIIQQRDSLRTALFHSSSSEHLNSASSTLSPKLNTSATDQQMHISVLESEHASIQKTYAELKEDFKIYKKESKTNAIMMQEENNKLRDSLSDTRLQLAKSTSSLEFTQGRFEQCKSNLEMERKELTVLRENSQKYSSNIAQHQQTISMMQKELYSIQEKLSHADVTIQNLKSERDQLKATEVRLLQEREATKSQHNSQGKVMAHLQAVQNNLERLESENQVKQSHQIKRMTEERDALRTQLDKAHEDYVSAVKAWEAKLSVLQDKLSEEQERGIKSREELVDSYASMHSLKLELTEAQARVKAAEEKVSKVEGSEGAGTRGMNLLRQQLSAANNEKQNIQQKFTHSQQTLNQYSTMVEDLNKQLKEEKETHAQSIQKMEAIIVEKTKHNKTLMSQYTEMTEQQNILSEELFRSTNEKDSQIQSLEKEVSHLKSIVQVSEQQSTQLKEMEQQFRKDRQEQEKLLIEAQSKYQRELVLHAADSQELVEARDKTSALEAKLSGAEEKSCHLEEMLEELRSAWGQQEESFKTEMQEFKQKALDAEKQCNALHQQLELMSSQLSAMKSVPDWTLVRGETSEESTHEHLQEVIRYLRKDKDIAVTQCTTAQSEAKRLQIRLALLESQFKEAEKDLQEERSRNRSHAATEAEHGDILKKMEMMNLLHESNRCLREEKETISKANNELKKELSNLQTELVTLAKTTQDFSSQVETLSAENSAVRGEIKKWQARAAALTEQSRRHDPQDFRRMEEENVSLKGEITQIKEETGKQQAELGRLNTSVSELRAELLSSRKSSELAVSRETATQKEMDKLKAESAENNKTTFQVKKIARKYKMQYDELKTKYDQLEASTSSSQEVQEASSAAHQAALEALKEEMTKETETKLKEAQEKAATEVTKLKEDLERLTKAEEQIKAQLTEKDERSRRIMFQAKKKLETLQGERETSLKSIADLTKEVKDLKAKTSQLETMQEENSRLGAQRSHFEAKAIKLEKDVKLLRDNRERLEKQIEEMAQRKQVARPSTSGGPVERASSTIQEPLTANIRPMTPPVVTSGSGVGLRHPSHPTPAAPRTTPTASIRPMAIGTSSGSTSGSSVVAASSSSSSTSVASASSSVASSSTGGHTTRMAAVPPTTANISSAEAHVLPTSSGVPQATVQPTPAIPAMVTPLAPLTPISEQTTSSSGDTGQDDTRGSHLAEVDDERCVASSSTSSGSVGPPTGLSGSVSVASTSPQTQVVAPTLKRQREEDAAALAVRDADSQPDTTGSSTPQLKRLRLAGEAQQQQPLLMERASVVTSGGGVLSSHPPQMERASSSTTLTMSSEQMTSSVREDSSLGVPTSTPASAAATVVGRQQEDLPPDRPGVIVTPEPQPVPMTETVSSGAATSSTSSSTQQQHQIQQQSLSSQHVHLQQESQEVPSNEPVQGTSDLHHYSSQEDDKNSESTVPRSRVEFSVDDSREDQSKVFAEEEDYEEEEEEEDEEEEVVEEDEEEEGEECMEEEGETYDDEKMQEARFSDEDEMAEETSPIQEDGEDMTEPTQEDQIITDDVEEESQMDAQDNSSAVPTVPGDSVLVGSTPSSATCAVRVPSSIDAPSSSVLSSNAVESVVGVTLGVALGVGTPISTLQQPPHRPPILPRVPPRSERLPSSQTSGFEDGDDGIVPSTPTLFVPRRGDGFAEAISSPHIPHGRFVFSSSVEVTPTPGFSQLASQGALGVDDTRMDLSQFDEGSGRSVPTTPLQVSPPADATGSDLPEMLLHPQQASMSISNVMPTSTTSVTSASPHHSVSTASMSEPVTSTQGIPTITVTGHEEQEEISQSSVGSASGAQDPQPIIEEPQGPDESAQSPAGSTEGGPIITEEISPSEEKGEGEKDGASLNNPEEGSSSDSPSTSSSQGRKVNRKPIVWKANDGGRIGRGVTPFSTAPSTRGSARGVTRGFKPRGSGAPGSGPPPSRGGWPPQRGWRGGSGTGPSP